MPVFDPDNAKGPAGAALHATATLLSGLELFWELCEETDQAGALRHLVIGIEQKPMDGDRYTLAELADTGFQANIYPEPPSQMSITRGEGSPQPEIGGAFTVFFRRHVREGEHKEDRNGLFLWWHDMVTAIEYELIAAAELVECPRLRGIVPDVDAAFGEHDEESAQGEYLWARFMVLWGDEVQGR